MFLEKFTKHYHPNAVVLLRGYLFFTILAALSTVFCDGTDVIRFLILRPTGRHCPIHLYYGKTAELMLMPTVFSMNALGIMFIFIGIERSIATVYASTYEKMKTSAGKAYWFYSQSNVDRYNPMSTVGDIPLGVQQTALGIQLGIEIINVIVFTALYVCNKRSLNGSRRVLSTLAYKYQINENMNSLTMILHLAWFHCVITILATVVILFSIAFFTEEEYLRYGLPTDLYPFYHCVFPVLFGFKIFQERRQKRKMIVTTAEERKEYKNQDVHFKMLGHLFEKPE
ncbi:hypothetical protein L596_027168 [Steinernema carpocapsae]|uniref:Uncharacterized protein n=1 Tax=Steinernema carpocapsae TaxID=34508 RepID=A0A4U5M3I7_STECR|nr:hypothetical protein L596_027168 [Steinernema carpocapsae]